VSRSVWIPHFPYKRDRERGFSMSNAFFELKEKHNTCNAMAVQLQLAAQSHRQNLAIDICSNDF
jgi:hypothetical protein